MSTTIPDASLGLLTGRYVAVIATVRPDGSPATAHVWIDWDGEHLLFSSRVGSRKGRNLRANPAIAIHVVGDTSADWIAIRGRVVETRPDADLALIDRLSERYKGRPYQVREFEREVHVVEVEHVRSSAG